MLALIVHFEPRYGLTNILVYLGICSLMGSLTVNVLLLFAKYIGTLFLYVSCVKILKLFISVLLLQVVSIKAIGIAIKLTLEGVSQIAYPQTWFFLTVAVICVVTQLNYLNKVSIPLLMLSPSSCKTIVISIVSFVCSD